MKHARFATHSMVALVLLSVCPGRTLAQDAVVDLVALGVDDDRLGHVQIAITLDDDIAEERIDAFACACGRDRRQ